ncbi:probable pseudouridine-5'-phosphatase [Macrosteles quadrilineatus]|uniref:probable pseudouridine-5'-phosphatase n=1 Tax=Macrosteles quadrilineatus TaxID=74068 RepID=UPI0023E15715|nr:probable pseudouridine-5'-phosphatase [Macrosteles quadrilineatus]
MQQLSTTPVTHVIFDLDGLLLDTESIYQHGMEDILRKYGKVYTDEVKLKVVGSKEQDTYRILVEELNLPVTPDELAKECFAYFKEALERAELKPGAEKLLRYCHKKKIPMALATSSGKETCALKLKRYSELCSFFSHMVLGSSDREVVNGKPAPDIFYVTARRFCDSPNPKKCLVFEDSYNGVLAAKAAGMQVVMVPEGLVTPEKQKEATVVLQTLNDFVPEMFGLPRYDD